MCESYHMYPSMGIMYIFSGYPIYKMVLDDGMSSGKFILAARKRKKAKTSSYLISTSAEDLGKDSPNYVAKVIIAACLF